MKKFVVLGKWTDEGIKTVKDTTKRAKAAQKAAAKAGGKMDIWWTMGRYDIVAVVEMPSEAAALGFVAQLGMHGNIRTETLPAWSASSVDDVLKSV